MPAIPWKIRPPKKRDLGAAQAFWREAVATRAFFEIYTDVPFDAEHFGALGPLTIDHFVPWSFVLHDECWNLSPLFRSTNSSKGLRLSDIDTYLTPLCHQQFDALRALLPHRSRHRAVVDSFTSVDPDLMAHVSEGGEMACAAFTEAVERVLKPLHQIALNQGFPQWSPEQMAAGR